MAYDDQKPIVMADFTGGLWERGDDRECPPNGLLEMTDCYALPTGGLRAGPKWTTFSPSTNLPTPNSSQTMLGFYVSRYNKPSNLLVGYIATVSTGVPQVLTIFASTAGTTALAATTWTQISTHFDGVNQRQYTPFVTFLDGTTGSVNQGDYFIYYNASGVSGNLMISRAGSTSIIASGLGAGFPLFPAAHQDRLIVIQNSTSAFGPLANLWFSKPGSTAQDASSPLVVAPNKPGDLLFINSQFPNDLYAFKSASGTFIIQGDLSSPVVRQVAPSHPMQVYSRGAETPGGVAYATRDEGIWLMNGGGAQSISKSIVGTPMIAQTTSETIGVTGAGKRTFHGSLSCLGNWLLTPRGYLYDFRTNAWCKTTMPSNNPVWLFNETDADQGRIYAAQKEADGQPYRFASMSIDEENMARSTSLSFTLPLVDLVTRNIELRRIEVFGEGFGGGGTWTISITTPNSTGVETTTLPSVSVPARAFTGRFNCAGHGDWVKVRVQSAGLTTSEAPMVHKVVLYTQSAEQRAS